MNTFQCGKLVWLSAWCFNSETTQTNIDEIWNWVPTPKSVGRIYFSGSYRLNITHSLYEFHQLYQKKKKGSSYEKQNMTQNGIYNFYFKFVSIWWTSNRVKSNFSGLRCMTSDENHVRQRNPGKFSPTCWHSENAGKSIWNPFLSASNIEMALDNRFTVTVTVSHLLI